MSLPTINCNRNIKLNFIKTFKKTLCGTNSHAFGITAGAFIYSRQSYDNFYNSFNDVHIFLIGGVGNTVLGSPSASIFQAFKARVVTFELPLMALRP